MLVQLLIMDLAKRIPESEYRQNLTDECHRVYGIINQAKAKGHDPKLEIEIPMASDLAERTQKLLKFLHERDTAAQIRKLNVTHDGNREVMALEIARIVCAESYLYGVKNNCDSCGSTGQIKRGKWGTIDCDSCGGAGYNLSYKSEVLTNTIKETLDAFESSDKKGDRVRQALCIYHGICAGLAVLTEGILVAPLEGVVSCRIMTNDDGSNCLAVNFAGPIRSAGGTGQALSVLIADILRRDFELGTAKCLYEEIERYKEEVSIYRGLQYRPSNPELEILAGNCPIFVDGEGVGKEVTGQRDLQRVKDNKVREGALLVMCEGLVLKAPKILKYVDQLELDGWDWLNQFLKTKKGSSEIKPNPKYMAEVLAGRPIFGMPMETGGFRLRYGRSRLAGLATTACHPASMKATSGFVSIGTQLKYERPGKGTVVTPCDTVQGPYVQWLDGSANRVQDSKEIPLCLPNDIEYTIQKVWDLGELLVPIGEFLENNHPLLKSAYVPEWHEQMLTEQGISFPKDFLESIAQSKIYQVPLHPDYVAVGWQDLSALEAYTLMTGLSVDITGKKVKCPEELKELVYRLNINIDSEGCLWGPESYLVLNLLARVTTEPEWHDGTGLDYINSLADFEIKPRTTYRIGCRMGKPEGSKMRDMKPSRAHCLFPIGKSGGMTKLINNAAPKDEKVGISSRFCPKCKRETHKSYCSGENDDHELVETNYHEKKWRSVGMKELWDQALDRCQVTTPPATKGVENVKNAEGVTEPLEKGILRAKHGVSVFRDGTIRFDMVDITMTHFRPREIGLTLEKAHQLGYLAESLDDTCELFTQDVVVPQNCADDLVRVCQFTDDLLEKLYGLEPYYNVQKPEDLIGQMIMGIAPHTSGAILGRIIGFTTVKGHYGHPFYHAAKRRNCDGDIDAIIMLTEGLLNFSRQFLPRSRGGQMDAPLILTMGINGAEIDKEALNVDTSWKYTNAFYNLTWSEIPPNPKEALKTGIEIAEDRLGTAGESEGYGFTHDTTDCNEGPAWNPYNDKSFTLTMRQKTMAQFALGEVLVSVDNLKQSAKLIDTHLIRDMRGNLRAFGQQKVRCTKCGAKYRRVPISGTCMTISGKTTDPFTGEEVEVQCPGNLIMTVSHGSVSKYDSLMGDIIARYGCEDYISQLYSYVSYWVEQTFEDPSRGKQQTLW